MRVQIWLFCLFMCVAALQSCRTENVSSAKDVVGSPGVVSMKFVTIPAGTFMMGSPDDEAERNVFEVQHQVIISKAFEMQTTEVTQSQWVSVMGSNPSVQQEMERFEQGKHCPGEFTTINNISMCPNNPVEAVSWNDAQAFISKLNAKADGYLYRLPTEAEWEYSARAGTTGAFAGDPVAMAWYYEISSKTTHPVGKKQQNAWGLYDMMGNVMEWVADSWYNPPPYSASPVIDPWALLRTAAVFIAAALMPTNRRILALRVAAAKRLIGNTATLGSAL